MAKLTAKDRKALPASDFAGPGRSYPIPDRSHAANAKARAQQQFEKGNLSASMKATIDARANALLKHDKLKGGMAPRNK
jgi:hypothetical protein